MMSGFPQLQSPLLAKTSCTSCQDHCTSMKALPALPAENSGSMRRCSPPSCLTALPDEVPPAVASLLIPTCASALMTASKPSKGTAGGGNATNGVVSPVALPSKVSDGASERAVCDGEGSGEVERTESTGEAPAESSCNGDPTAERTAPFLPLFWALRSFLDMRRLPPALKSSSRSAPSPKPSPGTSSTCSPEHIPMRSLGNFPDASSTITAALPMPSCLLASGPVRTSDGASASISSSTASVNMNAGISAGSDRTPLGTPPGAKPAHP
mmetsp:Transcript_119778/g.382322  ORF Transcript_119778/g.382322 Transcript_119778/m.382322 type:complete len:269 (-) Transcript_119778:1085-1891(-)